MSIKSIKQLLFAILFAGTVGPASATAQTTSVVWNSGLQVKVCALANGAATCEDGDMPELLGQVNKVVQGKYVPAAKASWLVLSSQGAAVCYFGNNLAAVQCVRVGKVLGLDQFDISALPGALIFKRRGEPVANGSREEYQFATRFMAALEAANTLLAADQAKLDVPSIGRSNRQQLNSETGHCSHERWIRWLCDDDYGPPGQPPQPESPQPESPLPSPDPTDNAPPMTDIPAVIIHGEIAMPSGCVYGPITICSTGPKNQPFNPGAIPPVTDIPLEQPGTHLPPPPPPPDDCNKLNDKVQQAKDIVGKFSPAACRPDMPLRELLSRQRAWLDEASARAKRDMKCWEGGDAGHQTAQAAAWTHAQRCGMMAHP